MEPLAGGRDGKIFLANKKVYRPREYWSESVHLLLSHLEGKQFSAAPKSFGFDHKGNEILSYVEGDVYNYPLAGNIASEQALISTAKLLRRYHDASASFISSSEFQQCRWMLPAREPYQVICHGDYAPYNVALNGCETVGIFDFDTAHPAPRIWDIAYAIYCWAPFKTNPDDALGSLQSQMARARLFCQAYQLEESERRQLVATMIERLDTLVSYMLTEAQKGNKAFIANINHGHHLGYLNDIDYLQQNSVQITQCLLAQ